MNDPHPTKSRLLALSRLGVSLYADHVVRFGDGQVCKCERLAPEDACNVGSALWRVLAAELRPASDGRNGP